MTKRILTALTLSTCLVFGPAAAADAAKKKPKSTAPTIKTIAPLKAQVGEKLVITGTNFVAGKGKTRVFFLRKGGGAVFARTDSGSKTRIVVTIPDSVEPLLRQEGTELKPTRFQLRVLGKKFGKPSDAKRSPVISAADGSGSGSGGPVDPGTAPDGDCDHDGVKNGNEVDDDNDLLGDDSETSTTQTDPCDVDTDGDTIEDGYEYESAKDLNERPIPYPGKRPYPNPLDADAGTDYDGDGLLLSEEHALWRRYGGHQLPLNYSDGTQKTAPVPAPDPSDLVHWYMDMDGDGTLSDDEKDADGDQLTNWDESHGKMTQTWWDKTYGKDPFNEKRYPLEFLQPEIDDPDTDGDTILDGNDDQDHDGLSNIFEVSRPPNWSTTYVSDTHNAPDPGTGNLPSGSNPWARVQPFNPCKPVRSPKCHLHPPFDYYGDDEDWSSPPAPAGVPVPVWAGGYAAP